MYRADVISHTAANGHLYIHIVGRVLQVRSIDHLFINPFIHLFYLYVPSVLSIRPFYSIYTSLLFVHPFIYASILPFMRACMHHSLIHPFDACIHSSLGGRRCFA